MSLKDIFVKECIKNREYLGFTYKDMANCLIDMSEADYKNFELGKYDISKENMNRLIRVLCLSKPNASNIQLEFDDDLSNDEKEDLIGLAQDLVGDIDD